MTAPASTETSLDATLAAGREMHNAGRFHEAEVSYRSILAREPQHAKARQLLGTLLHQTGRSEAAITELERAAQERPDAPAVFINLAAAYLHVGRAADALSACRRALQLNPESPEAHFNLGHALLEMRDWTGAITAYENHVRLNPSSGPGFGALGDALKEKGHFDAAMAAFETALTLEPDHQGTILGVADLFLRRGWTQSAVVVIDNLATSFPDDLVIRRRAAEIRLLTGRLSEGWDGYDDVRLRSAGFERRAEPPPHWRGEDLAGKRLLIWSEQGLGEEILYAGLTPDAIARGAKCTLACTERMAPIFQRSFPYANVPALNGEALGRADQFDFQVDAGSLGRYLRRDFASFPAHTGYLKADPTKRASARRKYEELAQGRRIVGLSWRSKHNVLGSSKSADLINLRAILEMPGIMFVNLQYGDCAAEIAAVREKFGVSVYQDPDVDSMSNFDDFFAQVAAVDHVISTSNTAVHAAGALNIPTWLLLPRGRGALWYWFLRRTDSPWYPSVKIIRAARSVPDEPWEVRPAVEAAAELAQRPAQAVSNG